MKLFLEIHSRTASPVSSYKRAAARVLAAFCLEYAKSKTKTIGRFETRSDVCDKLHREETRNEEMRRERSVPFDEETRLMARLEIFQFGAKLFQSGDGDGSERSWNVKLRARAWRSHFKFDFKQFRQIRATATQIQNGWIERERFSRC